MTKQADAPFKTCPCCGYQWETRDQFLADPQVIPKGYQVNFDNLEMGLFLFDHGVCGTTMTLFAGAFASLYDGTIWKTRLTGGAECPGHCLRSNELDPCPARCECAYVREVLNIVRTWKKDLESHATRPAAIRPDLGESEGKS